jgi:HEAT repeat protein
MTVTGALTIALFAISAILLLLTLVVAGAHSAREWRKRRVTRTADRYAPLVLRLVNAEESDESALQGLAVLNAGQWAAIRPMATRLLENLRGPAQARLADLFERRGVTAQAIHDTRSHRPAVRAQAAEILGQLRHEPAVPELCRLLRDRNRDVRQVATRALGRIGDSAAVLPLMETLGSDRPVPKHITAQAVFRLGPSAVPALAAAVDHVDPGVREVAIETLGMAGGYEAAPGIIRALRDDDVADVRVRAARALGTLGLPSAVEPLLEVTRAGEPAVREAAVHALGGLGSAAVVLRMRELLSDPAYQVGRAAAQSLLALGPPGREALDDADALGEPAILIAAEALAIASLGGQLGIRQSGLQTAEESR